MGIATHPSGDGDVQPRVAQIRTWIIEFVKPKKAAREHRSEKPGRLFQLRKCMGSEEESGTRDSERGAEGGIRKEPDKAGFKKTSGHSAILPASRLF
jgi:hypothetical protein